MTKLKITFISIFLSAICFGQSGEFKIFSSGLMYSDSTMKNLEKIVDSLNLKFKTCELSKKFYSKLQAKAHFIRIEKNAKEAKKDLENNISFDDFIKKYSDAEIEKELLIVKYQYKSYENKDMIEYNSIINDQEIEIEASQDKYKESVKGKWIFDYWEKTSYSSESIKAFYFITDFEKKPLANNYARMVQYTDCMVDTTTLIFKEDANRTVVRYDKKENGKIEAFLKYINKETNKPEYDSKNDDDDDYEAYYKKYKIWDSVKYTIIDTKLIKEEKFNKLLKEATEEAISKGGSYDEFEEYVGKYYSPKTALELKRGRIVVGGCSMDNSPRIHAMNIAILSAEALNWETFVRAHLDIMNDRFERMSDGSYAWGKRNTYIKELEELDINVTDLLLGISLRIENPSKNHYFGSIGRIGRALSESKNANEIEIKMLEMIKDSTLDDYNRILMYYLYVNYNYYVIDENEKKENEKQLNATVNLMPDYIKEKIRKKEK